MVWWSFVVAFEEDPVSFVHGGIDKSNMRFAALTYAIYGSPCLLLLVKQERRADGHSFIEKLVGFRRFRSAETLG